MQAGRSVVVLNVGCLRVDGERTMEAYQKMGAFMLEKMSELPQTQGVKDHH